MADKSLQLAGSPRRTRMLPPACPEDEFRSRLVDRFVEDSKGTLKISIKG